MSSFRRPLVVKRKTTGSYVDGEWIEGTTTTIDITASVQPLKPEEVQFLDEGRRNSSSYFLFTDTKLNLVTSANPDLVTINGVDHEIQKEESWQNNVINHYKYRVLQIQDR